MRTSRLICIFVLSSMLLISLVGNSNAISFSINLVTDKQSYSLGENVTIAGLLLYNGTALANELVSLQLDYLGSSTSTKIYRTFFTSVAPPGLEADLNGDGIIDIIDIVIVAAAFGSLPGDPHWNPIADLNGDGVVDIIDMVKVSGTYGDTGLGVSWMLQVLNVYVGDLNGYPVSQVKAGGRYFVYVSFRNNQYSPLFARITYTIYDANNVPILSFNPFSGGVQHGEPYIQVSTWDVPSDVTLGQATIYASAFTDYPSLGGRPYCPERSNTFSIVSSLGLTQITTENPKIAQTDGEFETLFRLRNDISWQGTYAVYAASFHKDPNQPFGTIATNSTTFQVVP